MQRRSLFPLAALALLLTACNKTGGDGIVIGEFASLTGKEATFGISSHEGTQLAVETLNAAGGVLGKKIDLMTEKFISSTPECNAGSFLP